MNTYKSFNFRDSAIAMACSLVFTASCLMFVVGPAVAATQAAATNSVVVPLA